MDTLHKNHLWHIQFDDSNKLFWIKWAFDTDDMEDDEFKNELKHYLSLVQEHHPEKVLIDTSEFQFIVTPTLQAWVDKEINGKVHELGVNKIAFLTTKDIFSQVSIEQTVEEKNASSTLNIRFFDDSEKASTWLNS